MDNTTPNREQGGAPRPLPETVIAALIGASDELSEVESWAASRRTGANGAVQRVMSVIVSSQHLIPSHTRVRAGVRQQVLRLLAYLPADMRLSCLIDLSTRDPDALDDLFAGRIAPEYERFRFNIICSLGAFARHGLIEEVFTDERIRAVGEIMRKQDDAKRARHPRRVKE